MRKKISLICLVLFLLCGCNANTTLSSSATVSTPVAETSSSPESTASAEPITTIGSSTRADISAIPKPNSTPRRWGLSTLRQKGLELVEGGTDQQFGGMVGMTYLNNDTVVFVTGYQIYEGELIPSPDKNLLRVYEYKISEKKLTQVYEERIGSDDNPHISGRLFIKKYDEKSLMITDTYFSFRLSLPDYSRIEPGTFGGPIAAENELYNWKATCEDSLYKNGSPYIKESGFVGGKCDVIATLQGFDANTLNSPPRITFKFSDGRKNVTIPIKSESNAIDHYTISDVYYANTKPYFIALIGTWYDMPGDLPAGAHLNWWEDRLLICNYETGEYEITEPINGISELENVVFNSTETTCILQTREIDQYKSLPEDPANRRFYSYAYQINIEEFIKKDYAIPGASSTESQLGSGHDYLFLRYPSWSWMQITWEYPSPYFLIVDAMGFSREEAKAIIDSNYAQPVVDALLKKHQYFGLDASCFYDGRDISLTALLRGYWNGIPVEETMDELQKEKEAALKLAASMPAAKSSPCLSELTKDVEGRLATAVASHLFQNSTASYSSLWKNNTGESEGLDLTLPGSLASVKYYSVSSGIVVRPHAKATDAAVVVFNPQEYLSCFYDNDYSLPSVSNGKIVSSGTMLGYADGRKSVYTPDNKGDYRKDTNGNFYKVALGTGDYKKVIAPAADSSTGPAKSTTIHLEIHEGYHQTEPAEECYRHGLSPYLCLNENEYNNIYMPSQQHQFTIFTAYIRNDTAQWEYIIRCTCGKTHSFTRMISEKNATCLSEGLDKYYCYAPCDIFGYVTVLPSDDRHQFGQWEPSKTNKGTDERKCSVCGTVEYKDETD